MKNLIFLLMMVGTMLVSCIPVPACDVGSYDVAVNAASVNVPIEAIEYIDAEVITQLGAHNLSSRVYDPGPKIYTAGITLESIDSGWIAGIIALLLGFATIPWVLISKVSSKVGNISETIAKGAYTGAAMLTDFKLTSASTLVKEGAEIVDELGDVATVLGNVTADGKFSAEDAKAVLKEGKDVIVAMKDLVLIVKPKVQAV